MCMLLHVLSVLLWASTEAYSMLVQLLIESLLIRYTLYACVNIFVSLILMSILANERNKLIEQQKTNSQKDI